MRFVCVGVFCVFVFVVCCLDACVWVPLVICSVMLYVLLVALVKEVYVCVFEWLCVCVSMCAIACDVLCVVVCCCLLLCLCYICIKACMCFDGGLSCDFEFIDYGLFVAVVCVVDMNVCGLFG